MMTTKVVSCVAVRSSVHGLQYAGAVRYYDNGRRERPDTKLDAVWILELVATADREAVQRFGRTSDSHTSTARLR